MKCEKCGRFCRRESFGNMSVNWHCSNCKITYPEIRALEVVEVTR